MNVGQQHGGDEAASDPSTDAGQQDVATGADASAAAHVGDATMGAGDRQVSAASDATMSSDELERSGKKQRVARAMFSEVQVGEDVFSHVDEGLWEPDYELGGDEESADAFHEMVEF